MMQDTSIESFMDILPDLGSMQNMVYNVVKAYPGSSNLDISRIMQKPINSVTPRVKELRDKGLVVLSHYKTDRVTGRRMMCWMAAPIPC